MSILQTQSTTPTLDSAQRTIERRAVEAVICVTPAVNFDRMPGDGPRRQGRGRQQQDRLWVALSRLEKPDPYPETPTPST